MSKTIKIPNKHRVTTVKKIHVQVTKKKKTLDLVACFAGSWMHKICNLNEDSAIKHHYLPCPITKNMRAREIFLKIMIPTPLECDVMKEKKTIKVECAFDRENMSNGKQKFSCKHRMSQF